jgi:hypothetical protein
MAIPSHHVLYPCRSCLYRYISGRLPAYQNLQSLTWCVTSLSEKQQVSFSKSVVSLMANGLAVLTLFCDHNCDPAAVASSADIKKYHEVCSFSIKGILAAAHTYKHTIKEINFVRLSLHPPCVSAILEAPYAVQRCLKFHGKRRFSWFCIRLPSQPLPAVRLGLSA